MKQQSVFEVEINEKMYRFLCDNDSPLGCVHDALMKMKGYTVERMVAAQKEEQSVCEKIKEVEEEIKQEA